jgi:sortase A
LGGVILLILIYNFNTSAHDKPDIHIAATPDTPKVTQATKEIYYGLPTRLKIPSIDVDTDIEHLGNTSKGDMEAPKSHTVAGWYKYRAIPGDTGSAVIAGHVIGIKGQSGVFAHLGKLQKGDKIEVVDAKGQTAAFTVRETRNYKQTDQPDEVFNSPNGTHLNLITCAGEWDAVNKRYMQRLVVFADKQ